MKNIDLTYLCTVLGNLSGIPVRIYKNNVRIFYYSTIYLPKDPVSAYLEEIHSITKHISYFSTEHFHYYGIVNWNQNQIVIGPVRQITESEQELRTLAFKNDVEIHDVDDFIAGMQTINTMPIESMMQILCTLNYTLNNEKISFSDISITDSQNQSVIIQHPLHSEAAISAEKPKLQTNLYNTYEVEQHLLNMIRKGDVKALFEWTENAPAVRGGILASNQLRQQKNTFIVTAALASRAAIQGGLKTDDAFSLSDAYIQKCELLNSLSAITNLQYRMIFDFTQQVSRLRHGKQSSQLVIDVCHYIKHHISEPITVENMSKAFFISRSYLSKRFKAETGETLTDFILKEKTEEAKRLLRYSDKPLTAIGLYLGFSSHGHFSRVFRKYTSLTPREYRQKYRD